MKILRIFTFYLIIVGCDAVITVRGYRGRSVQIECKYESGYEKNKKYLCRGECRPLNKDIPVKSGSPSKDGRFSLYDDTTTRIFTVTITDLRTEDANTYWCGVEKKIKDFYTEHRLLVIDDSQTTQTVRAVNTPPSTGVAAYILISTSALVVAVGMFIAIYRRNCSGSVRVMQSSNETNEDNVDDRYVLPPQAREMQNFPESVHPNLDRTTNQSESVYQNLSFNNNQSDSVYHTLALKNNQSESVYQSPTPSAKQ